MSPRESNEATGTETGSVRVAVMGNVAFSSKHPPPDMRLRRDRRDQAGSSVFECVLSVRTRSDSDAAYRSLARSAQIRGGRTKLLLMKLTDGTAKVKEPSRYTGESTHDRAPRQEGGA